MKKIFSSTIYLIITVSYISLYGCAQRRLSESQLNRYINHPFFEKMIINDDFRDSICGIGNFIFRPYTNDSIGINRFIAYLLASSGHINGWQEYEDYFGNDTINRINLNEVGVKFPQFDSLEEYKKPIYITVGLQFINNHLNRFNNLLEEIKSDYIYPFGGYYTLFLMILDDVRRNKYRNLNQYIPDLIQIYNHIVLDDHLLADMVLDVIRRSKSTSAMNFIKGKHFLSDDFNSQEFIHVYDSIGDTDYTKFVNPSVLQRITH